MKFKAHVAFTSILSLTLACVSVAWPSARAEAATCKKTSKRASKLSTAAPKKVTAASIVKWHRRGQTSEEILARIAESDYTMGAKDKAVLVKGKVPKSVIAGIPKRAAAAEPVAAKAVAKKGVKAIDLKTLTRPEDIDFDSIPPPKGMPKEYVSSSSAPSEGAREQAAREKGAGEQAAREKGAREQAARERPEAVPAEPVQSERPEKTARAATGKKAGKEPVAAVEKPAQRRVVFSASE